MGLLLQLGGGACCSKHRFGVFFFAHFEGVKANGAEKRIKEAEKTTLDAAGMAVHVLLSLEVVYGAPARCDPAARDFRDG